MEVLKKGTRESLLVPLRDRLGNITALSSVTSPSFYTTLKDSPTQIQSSTWVTDPDFPMTAICEIDTSLPGYVLDTNGEATEFALYLTYVSGTEHPILGPIYFRIDDD